VRYRQIKCALFREQCIGLQPTLNRARVHSASSKLMSWNCPLCNWFAAPTLKGVVRHVGKLHAHEAGFRVCCGVSGCPRTYTKFHSYRKHMYVHHREELDVNAPDVPANHPPEGDGVCASPPASPTCDDHSLVDGTALSRREAAMFLPKTKEIHKVSQSYLGRLIGDISFIVESTVQQLEKKVEGALEDRGVGMNDDL